MELALGLIETRGLIGAIEAADAMVKTANVQLIGQERISDGLVTVKIIGQVAAVQVAVEAGAAAAQRVGQLISAHVIPRPDDQIDTLIFQKKHDNNINDSKDSKNPTLFEQNFTIEIDEDTERHKKIIKKFSSAKFESRLEELKTEAFKELSKDSSETLKEKIEKLEVPLEEELAKLNVHKLRRLARSFQNFPIKGREISRANRDELIAYFNQIR